TTESASTRSRWRRVTHTPWSPGVARSGSTGKNPSGRPNASTRRCARSGIEYVRSSRRSAATSGGGPTASRERARAFSGSMELSVVSGSSAAQGAQRASHLSRDRRTGEQRFESRDGARVAHLHQRREREALRLSAANERDEIVDGVGRAAVRD